MGNIPSLDTIDTQSLVFYKKIINLNTEELNILFDTLKKEQSLYLQERVDNIFTNNKLGEAFYKNIVNKHKKVIARVGYEHKARVDQVTEFLISCKSYFFEDNKRITEHMSSAMTEDSARRLFRIRTDEKLDEIYLKKQFRKLALVCHPDRKGGNKQLFEEITEAYILLQEKANMEKVDKQFNILKDESREFRETLKRQGYQNKKMKMGPNVKFDVQKFNKLFQENRVESVEDEGYSDWIKKNKDNFIDESEVRRKMTGSSGGKDFNDIFASIVPVKKEENAILKYEGPQALYQGGEQAVELGIQQITNFGGGCSQIKYTDLREAHSGERMIDPNDVSLYDHKNVDTLKKDRSNIKEYSEDEWSRYQQALIQKEEYQKQREEFIKKQDELSLKHYDSIHSRMLENVWRQ
jgi:curved DNA-binding protein CbpA